MTRFFKAALALSAATTPTLALAAPNAGRLPTSVVPLLYDITVRPDAQALAFSGSETVTVEVKQPVREIVLNAADLAITGATFDGKSVSTRIDKEAQRVSVTLPTTAGVGRHVLTFQWTGTINKAANGLFATDYTNADGSPARMLATQFEAPDARRFAPMWDEPAFKARFRLSATALKGQVAFSNMPSAGVVTQPDGSRLYHFGETPLMSSYLLFLGVGEMDRKTARAGATEIGIISRRGVVDQGDYALGAAGKLLAYYNDYFGQPYPLPKMDMIAGPGSSQFFSAMENWGAIFYFETTLLLDPKTGSESNRQGIHTTVAHEMAHQWFGDLVTMRWWDDLWLNEGFASWMENKATNDLNPSWKANDEAVASTREGAMGIDATSATHPIIRHVETPDQIGEAFDGITYSKGEAVIGMLEDWLGADTFRTGIRSYMARYKYGNTDTDQLWAELATAARGKPVAEVAHDFTLQAGVPLITMAGTRCAGGATTVQLSQGRFGLDQASKAAQSWHVPLDVAVVGGGDADTIVTGATPAATTVKGCGTVVLNHGKHSYARVMYDEAGHAAIVRDYRRLDLSDRLGTLGDDFALAAGGYQDLSRYFAVQDQVGAGADPLEWGVVAARLGSLSGSYQGTPLEAPLRVRSLKLLSPELQRIGLDPRAGEAPPVSTLREGLLARLGADGDPMLVARAREAVTRLRTDPNALPPGTRNALLSTYAVNATPAEWEGLLALAKAERNPVVKNRYIGLLGASRDRQLAQRSLDLLKGDDFTAQQKASLLRTVAGRQPDMAFDWATANRDLVNSFLEPSTAAQFIPRLGAGSNDPAMPGKIRAYAKANLPASAQGGVERLLAGMAARREVVQRLQPAVARWVAD